MVSFQEVKLELPMVRENVPLRNHTTFKIGGPAKYFFIARTSQDIQKAVATAIKLSLPYFLLSGGSNVLISDKGFNGLVIKIQNTEYTIEKHTVRADSGVSMTTLVRETTQRGLAGLEWAGGLPGTVGGAIRGNAGAFGGEIKDAIISAQAIDEKGTVKMFSKQECEFSYRNSIFKQKNFVVLNSNFLLRLGNKEQLQKIAKEHIKYRKERHPLEYPNAGSIFKNCDVKKVSKKVQKQFADVVKEDPFPVIPTAAILSAVQLQGLRVGDAQISDKHPNYIVNRGNATSKEVTQLIKNVQQRIKKTYNINLEAEIQFVL